VRRCVSSQRGVLRTLAAAAFMCLLSIGGHASAEDVYATAKKDVIVAADFRVRVSAALLLGRSKDLTARGPLERGLGDPHPAVRSASAAALNALNDKDAVPALERQLLAESSESVKSQIRTSLEHLKGTGTTVVGASYVVQLGTMKNSTAVRGDALAQVLRKATREKASSIPKTVVADVGDAATVKAATDRKVPVLALDGTVLKLTQGMNGQAVTYQAQVEFSLRRVSDQTLKGLLTGSATSMDSVRSMGNQARMAELQDQAVEAAVESALRGADITMSLALK
jgi:hypothetical protein